MQRLGFSQVHSECDKFPATLSSQWHTHKCQQACFILHPYVAMGTAHGSEGRGQAEGWGGRRGCSLQNPRAEPETPRADKDMEVLRAWDICRTGSPSEITWVFVARDSVGEGWSHTCSLAPLLYTVDWIIAAFACLPSFQNTKYFYMKYLDLFN